MVSRRGWITQAVGGALVALTGQRAWGAAFQHVTSPTLTIFKSRSCGCCQKWVEHIQAHGFTTVVRDEEAMDAVKDTLGVPMSVRSCHTTQVGGYLVEGHVPAEDIKRLLDEQPKVLGLAVPGMPSGTPGMAEPGAPPEPYEVVSFVGNGTTRVYARH